jgi:hypothetical protein
MTAVMSWSMIRMAAIGSGSSRTSTPIAAHSWFRSMAISAHGCIAFSVSIGALPANAPGLRCAACNCRRFNVRLALQLRALDGEQAGASRREIAAVLLDPSARTIPAIEWKNAALRKKVNRIVASAIALMNGGYLTLLRGDPARAKRFRRR